LVQKTKNRPESEVTNGGNTSINVPGVNIGTGVISPGEGGSDNKIDGSTVLPSNLPLTGKLLMYQKYLESKQKQEEKKEKKKKETEEKRQKTTKEKTRKTFPTAKNWTGKLAPRVDSQCLYHDAFTTYLHHFPPNDLSLMKDIIQDTLPQLHHLTGAPNPP
jgi:hypothetical protein